MINNDSAPPQRIGILIVGLAGQKGQTLAQGYAAHKNGTQPFEIDGVDRYPLATDAVIGGWDISPLEGIQSDVQVFKGVYDASFDEQNHDATHVVMDAPTLFDKVERLRQDIRSFIRDYNVDGHTTIIWLAGKERAVEIADLAALLRAIITNSQPVPPSLLYAVAAALEACSFVDSRGNALTASLLFNRSFRIMQPSGLLKRFPSVSGLPAYFIDSGEISVATMVHVAVWCDFFARHHVHNKDVTSVMRYLLKERVDHDGFERQMKRIQRGVHA